MSSILIVGVIRNCAPNLESEINNLDRAFSDFSRKYFFVESDSSDDTVKKLNDISLKMKNLEFLSLGNLSNIIPSRVPRLSYCRNRYLEYMRNIYQSNLPAYIVVVDMDGVNSKLSKESVNSCFHLDNWEVCTANQKGPYYDIYALRAANWNEDSLVKSYNLNLEKYKLHVLAFYFTVVHKMLKRRGCEPIEVESAFGGLAIYKTSALSHHTYNEKDENGNITCEHVALHRSILSDGGRIIINPRLINSGWTSNSRRAFLKLIGLGLLGKGYYYFKESQM
jgi:hypothetical protein